MTTWADLLVSIRVDLQDDEGNRWDDTILELYATDALRDYSQWFPCRKDRTALTLSNGSYALPTDFVDVFFVECPMDRYLEERRPRSGVRFPAKSGRPSCFYIQGGNLYLDGSPLEGDEVLLTYAAAHTFETLPPMDEELIRLYVKIKVYERMRTRQAALDRFKSRSDAGGSRQDNPLLPEVDSLRRMYEEKIAARVAGGAIMLHRIGRMS